MMRGIIMLTAFVSSRDNIALMGISSLTTCETPPIRRRGGPKINDERDSSQAA